MELMVREYFGNKSRTPASKQLSIMTLQSTFDDVFYILVLNSTTDVFRVGTHELVTVA